MMDMAGILERAAPVLPVLGIEDPEQAVPLAGALLEGGISVLEVALRTEQALEAIRRIRAELPGVLVGAGTVLGVRQMQQVQQAGGQFAVSPGFTRTLADAARQLQLPWLPGVQTASEVMQAREAGFRQLKLFPAGGERGLELLDSYAGPFSDVRFCPTGGIGSANLARFLKHSGVICCGGSWLAPPALVEAQDWAAITTLARQALQSC